MWKPIKSDAPHANTVKVALRIPEAVLSAYEDQAVERKRPVEDVLTERLSKCLSHLDQNPIYLSDKEVSELSQIATQQITCAADLIQWAKQLTTFKVGEVEVPLSATLVKRLETRRFGKTWNQVMNDLVTDGLEKAVGMR